MFYLLNLEYLTILELPLVRRKLDFRHRKLYHPHKWSVWDNHQRMWWVVRSHLVLETEGTAKIWPAVNGDQLVRGIWIPLFLFKKFWILSLKSLELNLSVQLFEPEVQLKPQKVQEDCSPMTDTKKLFHHVLGVRNSIDTVSIPFGIIEYRYVL